MNRLVGKLWRNHCMQPFDYSAHQCILMGSSCGQNKMAQEDKMEDSCIHIECVHREIFIFFLFFYVRWLCTKKNEPRTVAFTGEQVMFFSIPTFYVFLVGQASQTVAHMVRVKVSPV